MERAEAFVAASDKLLVRIPDPNDPRAVRQEGVIERALERDVRRAVKDGKDRIFVRKK